MLIKKLDLMLTLSAPAHSAPNPHPGVQVQVPSISRLHVHIQPERVGLGVDFVRLGRILELFQNLPWTDSPAFCPNGDECGRVVVGLKEVVAVEVGGEIGGDELGVLAARLDGALV